MTEQRVQRRLAAILAADVVGYSALMQRAEEATYAEFERLKREVVEPSLSHHDGRLIRTTGDGALAEFASPSAAVRCAVEIQESIASGRSSLGLLIALCASADAANSAFALSTRLALATTVRHKPNVRIYDLHRSMPLGQIKPHLRSVFGCSRSARAIGRAGLGGRSLLRAMHGDQLG